MSARLVIVLLAAQAWLPATECDNLRPLCEKVRSNTVLFIGEVTAAKRESSPMKEPPYWRQFEFVVRVTEPFLGLNPESREVTLIMPNVWPMKAPVLFHMEKEPNGELVFPICGFSSTLTGAIPRPYFEHDLAWLRSLANGNPDRASALVFIWQEFDHLEKRGVLDGVTVAVIGQRLRREAVTRNLRADFHNLPAGRYQVSASKPGYQDVTDEAVRTMEIAPGACVTPRMKLIPVADSSPATSRPPRER